MTQYAYNFDTHSSIDVNFFYVMYNYHLKIKLKIEKVFFSEKSIDCQRKNKQIT